MTEEQDKREEQEGESEDNLQEEQAENDAEQ